MLDVGEFSYRLSEVSGVLPGQVCPISGILNKESVLFCAALPDYFSKCSISPVFSDRHDICYT